MHHPGLAPSLVGGLAGNAEPGADLGPGVAALTQAFDCYGYRGVDVLGQAEHEGGLRRIPVAALADFVARLEGMRHDPAPREW